MRAAVDDVIAMRGLDVRGLNRMMSVSLAVHVAALLVLFVVPRDWIGKQKVNPILMSISLDAPEGDKTGGMNPAPPRPIEKEAPTPKRPEPIRPAAPKSDVMAVPTKTPPKPTTSAKPPAPIARPPTTGLQVRPGTSLAETGSKTQGTGLAMGGGTGAAAFMEAVDFCCMEWAQEMLREIRARWRNNQSDRGETILKFTVLRNGTITEVEVEKPSGSGILDRVSQDALPPKLAQPLPKQYPEERLVIHLKFPYQAR
ncbi:MAG TPA: TonB C-terminal domain-containing protein [Vicinamibacterales bacterium]|nr:TonB C-terminal domain-containing protein [Vicinamibacterales bacterium]